MMDRFITFTERHDILGSILGAVAFLGAAALAVLIPCTLCQLFMKGLD